MSKSASFLSLYQFDPTNIHLRSWQIYRNLYDISLKTRSLDETGIVSKMNYYKRRLLVENIKKQHDDLLNNDLSSKEIRSVLESLIVFLMDTGEEMQRPKSLASISSKLPVKNQLLPSNPTRSSCFCDVVIVAMFLSTDKYDAILSEENLFKFMWVDKQLEKWIVDDVIWTNNLGLLNQIKGSLCHDPGMKGSDKEIEQIVRTSAKKIISQLFNIAEKIRSLEEADQKSKNKLAEDVKGLRVSIQECKGFGGVEGLSGKKEFVYEDAIQFFRSILSVGGWTGNFLSIWMVIRINEERTVQIPKFDISLPLLNIQNIDPRSSLQITIDRNWFTRQSGLDDPGWTISRGFIRISDPFVFSITRDLWNEKSITFPKNDRIKIPIMYYQNDKTLLQSDETLLQPNSKTNASPISDLSKTTWEYRIFAIACYLSSMKHYVLYFKFPGDNRNWYYYNDLGPVFRKADIYKDGEDKTMIETLSYLIWAERIQKTLPIIIPSVFKSGVKVGDFGWMIERDQYKDALFIFNDNVRDHNTADVGAGNAIIRPYNKYGQHKKYPRSAGISTGYRGIGFETLDAKTKKIIDDEVEEIKALIQEHNYKRIYWSSTDIEGSDLGTSEFTVNDKVRRYIVEKINELGLSK